MTFSFLNVFDIKFNINQTFEIFRSDRDIVIPQPPSYIREVSS